MQKNSFITHDFKLPDHCNEISKAEEIVEKIKNKLKKIQDTKCITNKIHDQLYEEIARVLMYVGNLSIPAFKIEDELERMYILQYPKSPELAKKLWLDHYESIHHPYTLLKNRLYKMLDELDEEYIDVYKKNPPNWNY